MVLSGERDGTVLIIAIIALALTAAILLASDGVNADEESLRLTPRSHPMAREAPGRNPVQFNFTVIVETPRPYVICVPEIMENPGDWTNIVIAAYDDWGDLTDDFRCKNGESVAVSITITPPFNQLNDTYYFVLRVYIKDNPSVFDEEGFSVIVTQRAGCELAMSNAPPSGEFTAYPSDEVTIRFAIYNTGNGQDRFLVLGDISRADEGWTLDIVTGVDAYGLTPVMPPDMAKERPHHIEVRVTMPDDTRAGVTAQVMLNVTSMFNVSMAVPPLFASVTSLQHYRFEVLLDGPAIQEGMPGTEVEFQLKIINLGNGWDTFTIKPVWDTDLNPGFIASANPRNLDVDALASGTVRYIVKVPESAPMKPFLFFADVRSTGPELVPVTKSFSVEVARYYSIEVSSDGPARMQTTPGVILEFEVVVHNAGNGLDSIAIRVFKGGLEDWRISCQPTEVDLLQGQIASVKVIVLVPSQLEKAPVGSHSLSVVASSSRSDARAELELTVEITRFYRIEWLLSNDPDRRFNPYEKDTVTYHRELKNYGNAVDHVRLDWASSSPFVGLSIPQDLVQVAPGETRAVQFTLLVDPAIPRGSHTFHLNATSRVSNATPRTMAIVFKVEHEDVLVPAIPIYYDLGDVVRTTLELDHFQNLSLKLRVENNGTLPLRGVVVKAFDIYMDGDEEVRWNFFNFTTPPIAVGDRFIVGERPFGERNPPLYWWANVSGEHTLEFRVYYPYQSNTDNDVSRLNVSVGKAPGGPGARDDWPVPSVEWSVLTIVVIVIIATTGFGVHEWLKQARERP